MMRNQDRQDTKALRRRQDVKAASRWLTCWTIGILAVLVIDMCRRGIDSMNLVPTIITVSIMLISGIIYWRSAHPAERRYDLIRKIIDPFYE